MLHENNNSRHGENGKWLSSAKRVENPKDNIVFHPKIHTS
jgi:hypothetical protein